MLIRLASRASCFALAIALTAPGHVFALDLTTSGQASKRPVLSTGPVVTPPKAAAAKPNRKLGAGNRSRDLTAAERKPLPATVTPRPTTKTKAETPMGRDLTKGRVIRFDGVLFAFDSAALKPAAYPRIRAIAQAMRADPGMRIKVGGHTDSKGAPEYNLKLSTARAASVKRALVERGIDPGRISIRGYGETRPVKSNATAAGRQENRRVEVARL
ncbi:MAG: OmpA family protein [Pseudomonadota bacterium]